jgi:hypothetical protein
MAENNTDVAVFVGALTTKGWHFFAYGTGAVFLAMWGLIIRDVPPISVIVGVVALAFFVGGYQAWRKERIDRNDGIKQIKDLSASLATLARPQFLPEITAVMLNGDHDCPDWIKLYIRMVVRNQGAESAIDRWVVRVVPPYPGTPSQWTEDHLNVFQDNPWLNAGQNLLNDSEVISRGGSKKGWLMCHAEKSRIGLTTGQSAAVKVTFKDVHNNEYSVVFPPNFKSDFSNNHWWNKSNCFGMLASRC